jgi:hypothetical protein
MAGGSDEVEQRMNTIIAEAGVTLDTGLLCENIVVLSLKVANNLTEAFIWSAVFAGGCSFFCVSPTLPRYQSGLRILVYPR